MRRVVAVLTVAAVWMTPAASRGDLPAPGCTRQAVEVLVRDFVTAYNKGDARTLEQVWAREPDFQWYFVQGERLGSDAEDRSTLPAYFSLRHGLGDELRLSSFRVSPANDRGHYGIGFRLRRFSDQPEAAGMWHGKASAAAGSSIPDLADPTSLARCTLIVWSMGKESRKQD